MPKLLSGSVLRSGGSGNFITLPGAQPALLPTPSTSTGYTLILDSQQNLSYSNSLGNLVFNSGTITTNISNGNISLTAAGTGTIQVNSPTFFNNSVTFANTFTFVNLTASGLIRFTNPLDSVTYQDGAVVISGGVGIAKTLNLNGVFNANTTANFLGEVNLSPIGKNINIRPSIGGSVYIFPDTTGYIDNTIIGYNNPQDGWFNNLHVLKQFAIDSTASSYSTQTGALTVKGGVGIGGNVYAGALYDQYKRVVTEVDVSLGKGLAFIGTPTNTGTTVQYAITNTGVTSITAGTGTFVTTSTGDVTIYTTGNTLQDVTNAGNSTTNVVLFRNTGTATSLTSASVVISGGASIGQNLIVGGSITAGSFAGLGTFDRIAVTNIAANTQTLSGNALYTVGGVGVGTDLTVFGNEFIYGNLTILGTFTTVISQISDVGRKVVALSTSAGPAILAADSGITVGPIANPFAKFLFDGVSNWRSTGGINPASNNLYNLGAPSLAWKTIYAENEYLYSTTTSVSSQTGALVVSGGVGIGGNLYAANIYDNNNRVLTSFTAKPGVGLSGGGTVTGASGTFTFTNTGVLSITAGTGTVVSNTSGNLVIWVDNKTIGLQGVTDNSNTTNNPILITNATSATSTQTGALIVTGGVGVGGDIYAHSFKTASGSSVITSNDLLFGNIITVGTDTAISTNSNVIVIWNTSTLESVTSRGNKTDVAISITNTSTSINSVTGALVVAGGVGIGDNLNVAGSTNFIGPVTFNGTATFVYSTNTYYTDNLIELHVPQTGAGTDWGFNDGKDIGVRFNYYFLGAPGKAFLGRNNTTGYLEWIKSGNETNGSTFAGTYGTFKTGSIQLVDTTSSTSVSSGALIVNGGAGIGGDLYVGGIISGTVNNANNVNINTWTTASLNYLTFASTTSGYQPELINTDLTYDTGLRKLTVPTLFVSSSTLATSTQTGAVVIAGGLGVGDSIWGSNIYSNGSQVLTLASFGNYGVSNITAGTGTAVSTSTGAVLIWSTATLDSVTTIGATTTNAIFVGSATATQIRTPEIYYQGPLGIRATGDIAVNTRYGQTTVGSDYASLTIPGISSGDAALSNQSQSLILNPTSGAKIQTYSLGSGYQTWEFDLLGFTKFPNNTLQTVGALKINSGNGYVEFTNNTVSTNTATGAVKIIGGLGVGGAVHAGSLYDNENKVVTRVISSGSAYIGIEKLISTGTSTSFVITNLGVQTVTGSLNIGVSTSTGTVVFTNLGVTATIGTSYIGVSNTTGTVYITNLGVQTLTAGTDTAVSSNTGTITVWNNSTLDSVTGRGATTTNAIYVGTATTPQVNTNIVNSTATITLIPGSGTVLINSNTTATMVGDGALKLDTGGAYIGHNLVVMGQDSSLVNTATNAVYVAGGVYVSKNLTVKGPTLFADTVTFSGTATYVYSTNTVYTDNLIEIHVPPGGAEGQWLYDDGKDIGLRFHYYNSTDTNAALVLANDSKELEWYSTGAESTGSQFANATYGTFRTGIIKLLGGNSNLGNTNTGDLRVLGGVGIGENLYVKGNITNIGTIYGAVTNIAGGAPGSIPIQNGTSSTSFIPLGNIGYVLTAGVNTATWTPLSGIIAGTATNAINVAVTTTNISGVYYPTFVASTSGFQTIIADTNLNYNPYTDVLSLNGLTTSNSTTTGALVVAGGAGIGGAVYAGSVYSNQIYDQNNRVVTRVIPNGSNYIGVEGVVSNGTATTFTFTNLGVQTVTGSLNIGVSTSTGTVVFTNLGVTATIGTSYIGVSGSTGSVTFTNLGVQTLTAGTDTAVSSNTGTITVWNTSTLQTVTNRGATTTNSISIKNATNSTSTTDGALQVTGGVGIAKDVYVGGAITVGTYSQYISYASRTLTGSDAGFSQNLDNWSTSTYRTAKYLLQAVDTGITPSRVHVSELSIFHNNAGSVYTNEYGITTNLGVLGTYDASVTNGFVQLQFTPNASGLVPIALMVKLTRLLLS